MPDLVSGYNIIEKLGVGARSVIYQVVKPETGQIYTLKRVVREESEDARFLEQAIREYEVSSRLNHPCLRRSFEIRKIRAWMKLAEVQVVMEFVNGVSLDKRRPERLDQVVELFIRLAEGLDALHAIGYLHADIKPNNVMVTQDGGLKIIDFGQSCPIGFRKPRIQGTPDYIAPEQVERRSLTIQTDVFNLGATLYWVLTGQTFPTLITKQGRQVDRSAPLRKPVPAPQELNAAIPAVLSRLVMESCAYRRSDRPRNMKEVIERLEMAHHVLIKRRQGGQDVSYLPSASAEADLPAALVESLPLESSDSYDYSALNELLDDEPGAATRDGGAA